MSKTKRPKPTNKEILTMIKSNYQGIGTVNQSVNLVAQTVSDFIDYLGKKEEFTKFLKERYGTNDNKETTDE